MHSAGYKKDKLTVSKVSVRKSENTFLFWLIIERDLLKSANEDVKTG
jgi:hypothetical protein